MPLADLAFDFTFGLLATFLGIGVIANVLIVYAVIQVLGERKQNQEILASRADESRPGEPV